MSQTIIKILKEINNNNIKIIKCEKCIKFNFKCLKI